MYLKWYFLWVSLFYVVQNSFGQEKSLDKLNVTHHSNFDAYPSKPIQCLNDFYKDSHGKIWLSTCMISSYTSTGLVSFDGYQFTNQFSSNSVLNHIPKNYIGLIDDKIYGTALTGQIVYLFYYDILKNNIIIYDSIDFERKVNLSDVHSNLFSPVFQRLFDDKIYTYTLKNNKVNLSIYDKDLKKTSFEPLLIENTNQIKYNHLNNVYKEWYLGFDSKTNQIISLNLIDGKKYKINTPIKSVLKDKYVIINCDNNTLFATHLEEGNYYREVFEYSNDGLQELTYLEKQINNTRNKSNFYDEKGQSIKYINNSKLYLKDNNNRTYDISEVLQYLSSTTIKKIYSDNFLNKLYILTDRDFLIVKLGKEDALQKLNINNPVRGIEMLDTENLIFLLETGLNQVAKINTRSKKIKTNFESLDFNHQTLLKKDNKIWGVSAGNIATYDDATNTFEFITKNQRIYDFRFDHEGNIVFYDLEGYFWRYSLETGTYTQLTYANKPLIVDINYTAFLVDKNGSLWVASPKGLFKYDLDTNSYSNLSEDIENFQFNFISIAEGAEDELWLGSFGSGLVILDKNTYDFKNITTKNGLCNNTIASITKDSDGFYWIGTYKGISVLNPDAMILTNLFESDGLVNNECNRHSSKLLDDGRIAIGTINGITLINPGLVKEGFDKKKDLNTYLTTVRYFDKNANDHTELSNGLNAFKEVVLPPSKNNITLEFATSNLINPLNNIYAYKISGMHKDWVALGNNPNLYLYNLSAGNHVLSIRGGDDKGNWSDEPIVLNIVVEQYFYKETWFYIILLLIVSTVVFSWIFGLKKSVKTATAKINADKKIIEKQAEELKKLDKTKNIFFTNITHEFRTPLTIIKGITQYIRKNTDLALEKELNSIEQNSNTLLAMVNKILDLSKLESNELKLELIQSDIVPYLDYIVDTHQYLAKTKDIALAFVAEESEIIMDFDPDKIKIIVTNLISNAIKYSRTNGNVRVKLSRDNNLESLNMQVQDTGEGFDNKEAEKVLERFYQAQNSKEYQKGSGIGLYHTQQLVKLMKGEIHINSSVVSGTIVTVSLPITRNADFKDFIFDDQAHVNKDITIDDSIVGKKKELKNITILIVEDNKSVRTLLGKQFNSYQVIFAEDGVEGIDVAIEKVPDIIISDVMMPNKDGFELCETLKTDYRTSHIPIILLTAKADQESKMEGFKVKADAYIYKPFEFEELQLRINNLLETRKKLQNVFKNLKKDSAPTLLPTEDVFILKLRNLILDNLTEPNFGIKEICEVLKISRAQLHNKIKSLTGLSISNYINSIRVQKAKELLEITSQNVSEVAFQVGISNLSYFSKLFKKEFGVTPKDYRDSGSTKKK